jgi:hypothetical protein
MVNQINADSGIRHRSQTFRDLVFEDAMRELIAGELRALEAQKSNTPEPGANADGTRLSAESTAS